MKDGLDTWIAWKELREAGIIDPDAPSPFAPDWRRPYEAEFTPRERLEVEVSMTPWMDSLSPSGTTTTTCGAMPMTRAGEDGTMSDQPVENVCRCLEQGFSSLACAKGPRVCGLDAERALDNWTKAHTPPGGAGEDGGS